MKKKKIISGILAFAAIFALVIGTVFFLKPSRDEDKITSIVNIDVNPSIELGLNKNEKVVRVDALNEEGVKVLEGMDLKGADANVAINAIVGSMLREGYLNDYSNSLLLSVDGSDTLRLKLTEAISNALSSNQFNGAILSHNIEHSKEAKEFAISNGISEGKAEYINKVASENPSYSKEELAKLSINELNLITESSGRHVKTISVSGLASAKKYISAESAAGIALSDFGKDISEVQELKSELDFEDHTIVYEIEFLHKGIEYEYYVDAANGNILNVNRDVDDDIPDERVHGDTYKYPSEIIRDIGADAAKDIAVLHAGIKDYVYCDVERDNENGRAVFEVEFKHGKYEYEYEIDVFTGEILKSRKVIDN